MTHPEHAPKSEQGIVSYNSFDDIETDLQKEGLRPKHHYAGGQEGDVVIVAGERYIKVPRKVIIRNPKGDTVVRPYTEKEYYSVETYGVDAGPGWDSRGSYLGDLGITDLDPNHLSNFPFFNLEKEESLVDRARVMIASAPARIEKEFQESEDEESWADCFAHRVDALKGYFFKPRMHQELTEVQWENTHNRLQTLLKRVRAVQSQYPDRNTVPPDAVKQELFLLLDIFVE
ncbi:hypothetical protein HY624_02440 [Candidatus Uhrbacteria bacterium]|nr:hypothetical protein [Candidatus Uhrbacteria bacterium]